MEMEGMKFRLDIEVYDDCGEGRWPQARYLVHGYDDVLWTNDLKAAILYLHEDLMKHAEPTRYYLIVTDVGIIGLTTRPDEVEEKDRAKFVEITKEQWDQLNDD